MSKFGHILLASFSAVALTTSLASPVMAVDATGDDLVGAGEVQSSIEGLKQVDLMRVSEPVPQSQDTPLGHSIALGSGEVTLPDAPLEPVVLTSPEGESIDISLPSESAGNPVKLSDGSVVFPGEKSATTVIPNAASVQLISTIESPDAPTRYEYQLGLSAGESLQVKDGSPSVADADGNLQYVIANPWAKDANGVTVESHFEIEGSTLVQVVEHDVVGTAYPAVADPAVIPIWVYRCLLGPGISGPQIAEAFATGTIWGGLGRAALACVRGK